MHNIDLSKYKIRTDLIVEQLNDNLDSQGIKKEERTYENINVLDICLDHDSCDLFNKKAGRYITISFQDVTDVSNRVNLEIALQKEIKRLLNKLNISDKDSCLIVGLGNNDSTPDALGPKVANSVLVTRHLFELDGVIVEDGYRNVSAFVPGVMGTTGIEASDIILGIIEKTKPDFVLVVDALASSSVDRVNKTIQMTDTGIHPGSGVGNSRKELSKETLGIPVIAIGVPTVVDAVTIVSNTINFIMKNYSYNIKNVNKVSNKLKLAHSINYLEDELEELPKEEKERLLGMVGNLSEEEMKQLIFEVLSPIGYNMMVTPKEVDFVIDKLSLVIKNGINKSLHDDKLLEKNII